MSSADDGRPRWPFGSAWRTVRLEVRALGRPVAVVMAIYLALNLSFAASFIGALHRPRAHRVPVAVVAPRGMTERVVDRLNARPGHRVRAEPASDEAEARRQVTDREVYAAYLVRPQGKPNVLLTAGAVGPVLPDALRSIFTDVTRTQHRKLRVVDIRPPRRGDARSLSTFFLVLSLTVFGCLAAVVLGLATGARRPADRAKAAARLAVLAGYAVVASLGGALLFNGFTDGWSDHLVGVWWLGALLVFAVAASTLALQVAAAAVGTAVAVLLFVVIGNPSSGGVAPTPMLPAFPRAIGPWLPNGAAVSAIRGTVYFDGNGVAVPCLVLAGYVVAAVAVALLVAPGHRVAPG